MPHSKEAKALLAINSLSRDERARFIAMYIASERDKALLAREIEIHCRSGRIDGRALVSRLLALVERAHEELKRVDF